MIKKRIAILVIISLIFLELYFKFISFMITGFVTIALSISAQEQGCIEYLDVSSQMVMYTYETIRVGVWNCGSSNLTYFNIQVNLTDLNNNSALIGNQTIYDLYLDEKRGVNIVWNVTHPPSIYTLSVLGGYVNGTTDIVSTQIAILAPPYVPPTPPQIPGYYPAPKVPNITINYPEEINMTPDSEYIVLIRVTNTGNLDINNLNLQLESATIQTEILSPINFSVLEEGSSVIFTTKFKTTTNIQPGTYYVNLYVSSDEVSRSGTIRVNVKILELKEEAAELIAYYSNVLDNLKDDIDKAESEGKNVTEARRLWNEAKDELDIAKNLFDLGMYSSSMNKWKT